MGWKGTSVGKGTCGLGDMGTWGSGDMGSRGHSTEDIHTFRVGCGDMGTWGLGDIVQKTYTPLGNVKKLQKTYTHTHTFTLKLGNVKNTMK